MKQTQTSRTIVFDIETDNLVLDVKKFWVGVTYCIETKEEKVFYEAEDMVGYLNRASVLVGHNIIGFDIPALNKLSNTHLDTRLELVDTLLLAKLAYYDADRSFGFSLEKFGERLGFRKGDHNDWSKYSKEMEEYCKRDVQVTYKLYQHLKRKTRWLPKEALELEQEVQRIVTDQHIAGWEFDLKKGRELHVELVQEKEIAEASLWETFKPLFMPKGKVVIPKRPFRRMGVTTAGPHQPIHLTTFNPGSGKHVVWWVERLYGKQDWKRTEKGSAKTDAETLMEMFSKKEWAKPLLHYLEVTKILGQLAEGPKAWLKMVREDNRIHGQADILGAVTGRFTHSNPNLAQVPSIRAYKGKEARSLFTVKRGYKLVGADASGLELRTLSHYLARYDGGAYGRQVLEGDIHTSNQKAAGLPTRDMAKTFIYGFLYGAGNEKIGTITGGGSKEGAVLKSRFLKKTKGLEKLVQAVKEAAKKGWIKGISGRRLHIRSPHSALNVLLQSAGAYYMKYWVVAVDKMIKEEGYDAQIVGNIHDEIQVEVREDQAEKFAKKLEDLFITVGEDIGMRIKMEGEARVGRNWAETH
jgi:DNA polymerase I-like protein with 3'-5' exonuclease and polymerase domains